jgi:uncharacterized protein YndB with AHSA1/START domain
VKIKIETTVNSNIAAVWSAWITPEDINQWNFASDDWHNPRSENDLRVGGQFSYRMEAKDGSMGFDFEGTYTKVIENEFIEYILGDDRSVSIEFIPVKDGIKVVEIFDTEDENSAELQRQGWQSILDNFAKHVESKV